MTLSFDATQTLALAIAVLFIGSAVIARVPLLRNNDILIPVVGGILLAIVSAFFHGVGDVELVFDTALRGPLMLAFFTTIGLGADLRQLRSGGPQLALFGAICVGYLVFQNTIGVIAARGMDLHPLVGLLSSSITLSGGHGVGRQNISDKDRSSLRDSLGFRPKPLSEPGTPSFFVPSFPV
jgi:ESS family glutamate:Na+ symporter